MKMLIILGLVVLSAIFLVWILFGAKSQNIEVMDMSNQDEVSIVLNDEGYQPRYVRISPGTAVTFSTTRDNQHWPASNLHPSHEIYPEFDPKRPLEAGETWTFVFNNEGEWGMHDHIRSYYTGIIYVGGK